MADTVNYRIEVHGRVQGVGYRYSAINMANRLGVKGYVKNMGSGTVLLEIEGNHHAVDEMIAWCRIGPGTGNVDELQIYESKCKAYTNFKVKY